MKITPFLFLCLTGFFAIFSSTISKSPVLPLFSAHLGATPATVGLIAAVSAFAGVVFSVPAGLMADRFGKRRMIVSSACIFASAPFCYLWVTKVWELALVRFYHGFATAIFVPVAMALVSSLSDREKGEKLGWFSSATLAGRFVAPLVGGAVIGAYTLGSTIGYRAVYGICAGAGLMTILIAFFIPIVPETSRRQSWSETIRAFMTVVGDRTVILTCLVEAAILFAYGTFETFLPLYAVDKGLSAAQVGTFLSGQIIVLALTKPMMGKFSDTYGRRPQIVVGCILGAVCLGGITRGSGFLVLFALSGAFGLSLAVVTSATSAYIADLTDEQARGAAMGLLGSIMDIGHTSGPLLSGIIATSFGYGQAFLGAALVVAGMAVVFALTVGLSD